MVKDYTISVMKKSMWIWGLCLLVAAGAARAQVREFRADDPNVNYVGRVLFDGAGAARFDWVGTAFRFRFSGNSCAVRASDTKKSFYLVFVDGKAVGEAVVEGSDRQILLAEGLEAGPHTLMAFKRTEAGEGATTLHAIVLPSGGRLLPWFGSTERRIEFIGNSITCGFGADTADPDARYCPETENAYHSYAAIAARYFGADCTMIAHSGQGVVRNYGDPEPLSECTMLDRYGKVFDDPDAPDWNFASWRPHVVVIELGTNDFSVGATLDPEDFASGYLRLIAAVCRAYGSVPVLCLSSPLSSDDALFAAVRRAAAAAGDNVRFVPILPSILDHGSDVGAGHPNYSGHRKIAMALIPYLSSATGWPCGDRAVE